VTVAAAPLYVVRWHVGPIPTTLLELLILVTLGLYAVTAAVNRGPYPRRTGLEIPIALFLIAGAIGVAVASDHRGALGIYRAYLLEPVALYYVAVAVLREEPDVDGLLASWSAGAVVFALVEIATVAYALSTHSLNPSHAVAAFGINPNSVAIYLEPLMAVAAGFALLGSGMRRRVALTTLGVLLVAELATLSRGGLLALAMLAAAAIVTASRPRVRAALIVIAGAGVLAVWKLPIIGPRLAHAADPVSGTFDNRGRIWAATFRMLRDHPVFGAGVNSYQSTMAPYRAADPNLVPEPYPHNILLTSWTEIGLLGLAAFAYILFALMVRPWRAFARAAGPWRPLLWGVGVAFAVILVHGLVDSPYWKNDLSVEFWILAALEVFALRMASAAPHSAC
jgi:putative inorganic carbon (HCO3(-)) transporter